jgi:hypothetical protein
MTSCYNSMMTKRPDSVSDKSDPAPVRSSIVAFLIAVDALLIPGGILFVALRHRPGGIQVFAMAVYTLAIPYVTSDRYLNRVPWDRLTRGKFLLGHCLALLIVYAITTVALAAYPHLPTWFTAVPHYGKKVSLLELCLIVIFLVLAVCEYSWGSRDEGEEAQRKPMISFRWR